MSEEQNGVENEADQVKADELGSDEIRSLAETPVEGTALALYGEQRDVYALAARMMIFHPAAREVPKSVVVAAAQVALALGANPLPGAGELDFWREEKDGKVKYGIRLGVQFHRRKMREAGGVVWRRKPAPMRGEDLELYGVANDELGGICEGCRRVDMQELTQQGFNPQEVWDMVGAIGVGTVRKAEWSKKGRPKVWTAVKRAEQDCFRQLFPNLENVGAGVPALPVLEELTKPLDEGVRALRVEQADYEVLSEPSPEQPEQDSARFFPESENYQGDLGFDPEPPPEPEPESEPPVEAEYTESSMSAPEIREQLRKAGGWGEMGTRPGPDVDPKIEAKQLTFLAATMSKALSGLSSKGDVRNRARRSVLAYVYGVASSKDLTQKEAQSMTARWTKPGSYELEGWAPGEVARLVEAHLKESGQLEMETE